MVSKNDNYFLILNIWEFLNKNYKFEFVIQSQLCKIWCLLSDTEGLITQALLLGNTEAAVELCLKAKRYTDAIIIAFTGKFSSIP